MKKASVSLRILALLFCILLTLASCASPQPIEEGICRIYFLDVGQGDCALIRTSTGDVLIDCGPEASQKALCRRLKQLGVTELALAVFTHPDEDHIGGADGVLMQIATKEVWLPDVSADNESALRMETAIQRSGAVRRTVSVGDFLRVGELFLVALSPMHVAASNSNDSSIVLKATFGNVSMMFMGDASREIEERLLETYPTSQVQADLYKVGHHGSATSNSDAWLAAVDPDYAVICVSADNSYGHPHGAVISALEASGARVLQTAIYGEIVFECNQNELYLLNEKNERTDRGKNE